MKMQNQTNIDNFNNINFVQNGETTHVVNVNRPLKELGEFGGFHLLYFKGKTVKPTEDTWYESKEALI